VRVDRLLERVDGVDVRRELTALDPLDDSAQQWTADARVVRVVGVERGQLAPRGDHRDRLEIRDHPGVGERAGVAGRRAGAQQTQGVEHCEAADQVDRAVGAALGQRRPRALGEAGSLQHDPVGAELGEPPTFRLAARRRDHADPRGAGEPEAGQADRGRRAA
jgi:hypothetical protein